MVLELVYLLVVEFLGVDDGVGIEGERFSEGVGECADIGVTFEPGWDGGLWDFYFEFSVDRCPGFLDCVSQVVMCDCRNDDLGRVRCALEWFGREDPIT